MTYSAFLLTLGLLTPALHAADALKTQQALQNYSQTVYAVYSDAYATASKLQSAVNQLVASPSAETLEAARHAWLDSRVIWGRTEAFRFYRVRP
ncbi:MAG TPA: imelysin family protein [Oligoflexus sp.]|uniref:imelysin family protein n=1 Tax=Oligoflexus sp. TaxID=1971216 RepID=UPI002D518F83|nr:imelysin family protein [Oligoflexus sp.]HYX31460.1 imelysin family protein [Oligoflexus sp.]